jgi:hypothetical protein
MTHATNLNSGQSGFNPDDLENFIQKQYPAHLQTWLKKNDPELYLTLISNIIPKCEDVLTLKHKLTKKENDLDQLKNELKEAEIQVAEKQAALRFWEGGSVVLFPEVEQPLLGGKFTVKTGGWKVKTGAFFNSLWDWLLKIGLSIVPILSLFSIFTISDLKTISFDNWMVPIGIFSGICLVWLTSATVCNWIITKEKYSDNFSPLLTYWKIPKLNVSIPNRFVVNRLIDFFIHDPDILIFFIIWLLEALIGWATVPPLIDLARNNNINPQTGLPDPLPVLTGLEKFEILIGVSIFAFVNILFAIAKGRIYNFNTERKKELGKAKALRDMLKILIQNYIEEIAELKVKLEHLEAQLKPEYLIKKFHQGIDNLSVWSRQGKDYTDIEEASNPPPSSLPVYPQSPTTNSGGVSGNSSSPLPPIQA